MDNNNYRMLCGRGTEYSKTALIDVSMLRMCFWEGAEVSFVFSNGFVLPMHYESMSDAKKAYEWAVKLIVPNWDGSCNVEAQSGGYE